MNYPQRMYSKTELGLPYFPDTTDGAPARRHIMVWIKPVSYTHLDVYKRQQKYRSADNINLAILLRPVAALLLYRVPYPRIQTVVLRTHIAVSYTHLSLGSSLLTCLEEALVYHTAAKIFVYKADNPPILDGSA